MTMQALNDGYTAFGEPGGFVRRSGPIYIKRDGKVAVSKLLVTREHTNSLGIASGGLLMMLLDITLGVNVSSAVGYAGICPTVQFNCNLVSSAKIGDEIIGEAHVSQVTRSLAFATAQLSIGGKPAATASGVFKIPSAAHQSGERTQHNASAR